MCVPFHNRHDRAAILVVLVVCYWATYTDPVTGSSPLKMQVMLSSDIVFVVGLDQLLKQQSGYWWLSQNDTHVTSR